jgi:hypothetical protein
MTSYFSIFKATLINLPTPVGSCLVRVHRESSESPIMNAFCRVAPSLLFNFLAIDNGKEFAAHQDIASVKAAPTLATPK